MLLSVSYMYLILRRETEVQVAGQFKKIVEKRHVSDVMIDVCPTYCFVYELEYLIENENVGVHIYIQPWFMYSVTSHRYSTR